MSDIYTKSERSQVMSKIAGKETKPEIIIRKYLFAQGYRYRKNVKSLPGKPDIVLKKYKTVIFVNGCFWHRHNCKKGQSIPSTNVKFWKSKLDRNKERDKENKQALRKLGWKVLTIWECQIKKHEKLTKYIDSLIKH